MRRVKKYVDESFVFWTSCLKEEIDLHFNEWYSPKKCWLDIGVRICDIKKSDTLYIYLPLNIKEQDIEDLYSRFDAEWVKNEIEKNSEEETLVAKDIVSNIACALFNSNCEITRGKDISHVNGDFPDDVAKNIIKIKHGLRVDYLVKLNKNICRFEQIKDLDGSGKAVIGGLLTIDCRSYRDVIDMAEVEEGYQKGLYIRFRIPHPSMENNNLKKGISFGTFINAPSRNTLIQYMQRINELRSLPPKLRKNHHDAEKQYIGKVMSMLAANKKCEIDDSECYKIRELEYGLHRLYVPSGFMKGRNKKNVNVYQWKVVNKNDDSRTNSFIFNIKIQRNESKMIDWLKYGAVGLFLVIVSAVISSLVTEVIIPLLQ